MYFRFCEWNHRKEQIQGVQFTIFYFFCLALSYLGVLSIMRYFKILLSFILDKSQWSPIQFDQPR